MPVLRGLPEAKPKARIGSWARARSNPLGYGVIGNTDDSGSFVLGSSPGTPAIKAKMITTLSAIFLVTATLIVAIFQVALALGAPLGAYAYGGQRTGKLPVGFRINSVVSAVVMVAIAGHYLAQLGVFQLLLDSQGNSVVNWVLVAFMGLSAIANNITRSKPERAVWGVPTILMFLAAIAVALNL